MGHEETLAFPRVPLGRASRLIAAGAGLCEDPAPPLQAPRRARHRPGQRPRKPVTDPPLQPRQRVLTQSTAKVQQSLDEEKRERQPGEARTHGIHEKLRVHLFCKAGCSATTLHHLFHVNKESDKKHGKVDDNSEKEGYEICHFVLLWGDMPLSGVHYTTLSIKIDCLLPDHPWHFFTRSDIKSVLWACAPRECSKYAKGGRGSCYSCLTLYIRFLPSLLRHHPPI